MGLKDALQAIDDRPGRRTRCRVCALIERLPEEDADALRRVAGSGRQAGPRAITEAIEAEYGGDWYHSVRHHLYVCRAAS